MWSKDGSISQGVSNATAADRTLNEPFWFTQTLGMFGSIITNR